MAERNTTVTPHGRVRVTRDQFPWINHDSAEVPTVALELMDEIRVAYGA